MGENREERNRVFGIPIGTGPHDRQGEEQQRVMGFPVGAFDGVNLDALRSLAHPIRGYKQWARRRRLGPYATDEDEQQPLGRGAARRGPARPGATRTAGPVSCWLFQPADQLFEVLDSMCTILPWVASGTPWHQGSCGCPRAGWCEAALSAVRFPMVPLRTSACICLVNRPLTSLGNHGGFAGQISVCLPIGLTCCPR